MVSTVKFSQFAAADLTKSSNKLVGLSNGLNSQSSNVLTWATIGRPTPPFNGLMGYNTDLSKYEYYDLLSTSWVQFSISSNPIAWSVIVAPSITASVNNGYITNSPIVPVNILLPATMNIGDPVDVDGKGFGGWILTANAGQQIVYGDQITSIGGSISSTLESDTIKVECITPNILWEVKTASGNQNVL